MPKVSHATFVDVGLVGSKGDAFCYIPMYKPFKFGYKVLLTKTLREDQERIT